jgi:hypothetical protein
LIQVGPVAQLEARFHENTDDPPETSGMEYHLDFIAGRRSHVLALMQPWHDAALAALGVQRHGFRSKRVGPPLFLSTYS